MLNKCRLNRHPINTRCLRVLGDTLSSAADLALLGTCGMSFRLPGEATIGLFGESVLRDVRVYKLASVAELVLSGECYPEFYFTELFPPSAADFTLDGVCFPQFGLTSLASLVLEPVGALHSWVSRVPTAVALVRRGEKAVFVRGGERVMFVRNVE